MQMQKKFENMYILINNNMAFVFRNCSPTLMGRGGVCVWGGVCYYIILIRFFLNTAPPPGLSEHMVP